MTTILDPMTDTFRPAAEPVKEVPGPNGTRVFLCEQMTAEWFQIRRGKPTCSNFGRILTPAKGQPSSQQDDYIAELIAERNWFEQPDFTVPSGGFVSDEMQEGIRREPEARSWYAMQADADVQQVGFVLSACGRYGVSPDGLVGDDGMLELKNPSPKVHVSYLLRGGVPLEYKCQVHGALIVTGRKYVDFCSYCPGLPALLVRVEPDSFTDLLRAELEKFLGKLKAATDKIDAMLAGMR